MRKSSYNKGAASQVKDSVLLFLGAIWLQCGDEVKQVLLPREGLSLGKIRQMFQNNFKGELEKLEFGADRCIVLIKDPFSRAFKELEDVR